MTLPAPYRVLVTGSRDWTDRHLIRRTLAHMWSPTGVETPFVVVHGACPTGADAIAAEWVRACQRAGFPEVTAEPHPADWATHGRAAGPCRNELMVNLGADVCLAFIRNNSRGASHTAALAERAGITVRRFTA